MKTVAIYISPNGTTRKALNCLGNIFRENGHEFSTLDISKVESNPKSAAQILKDADLIGIASPVYHLRIFKTLDKYLKQNLSSILSRSNIKSYFALVTYGGVTSGKALLNISRILNKNNIPLCGALKITAPHFWKTDGYPDAETEIFIRDFFNKLNAKNFAPMSFSKTESILSYQKKMIKFIYPFGRIIGFLRRHHISFDETKCNKCGRCIKECSINAIEFKQNIIRNPHKCAYCYHCAEICTKKAFKVDIAEIERIVRTNRKIAGTEYPQNEYFL
ncbi:MAG TPA: 4Fe-4S binding protein [Spirochaetota bacterium]|nr:4Fe-4S binding protein [Spirochaetota bacterium]HQO21511.1 4Fe-4S binding protein [Spirochaetota bacterium]HQQ23349.1 4Fe-4S binding protein [Spirochaetota bacterium]